MASVDPNRLNGLDLVAFSGVGYRIQALGFDARSGEGARRFGGRYNPPRSFPVIYLCLTKPCAAAELTRQAIRQSVKVEDVLPRELWAVAMELQKVLVLTDRSILTAIGLAAADLVRSGHAFTQQIGEAAHERRVQAIRAPSATGVDEVLAVFPENLVAVTLQLKLVEMWESIGDINS